MNRGRLRPTTIYGLSQSGFSGLPILDSPVRSHEIPSGSVGSGQLSITQEAAFTNTEMSTTDTTNWILPAGSWFYMNLPVGSIALYFMASLQMKHSAAAAEVGWRVTLAWDEPQSTSYTVLYHDNIYLATADKWTSGGGIRGYGSKNIPGVVRPGRRVVWFQYRNYTAGTLTIRDNWQMSAFVTGDSTV